VPGVTPPPQQTRDSCLCGTGSAKKVIDSAEHAEKIAAASEGRGDTGMVIIAPPQSTYLLLITIYGHGKQVWLSSLGLILEWNTGWTKLYDEVNETALV